MFLDRVGVIAFDLKRHPNYLGGIFFRSRDGL